ncbi:MAG TPA: hypothetical protein VFT99_18455, partial [Roseiflexaceae bacterium]|nr:hypothetical protein [Roseiflexaceae bacterium]
MTSNTTSQSDVAVQPGDTTGALGSLHEQLRDAAQAFAAEQGIAALLNRFAHDVERAMAEPLEIFPVCHHSAASALHMARRLRERPPRVVYIELCADMQPVLEYLRDCTLPVALQAFAAESDRVPTELLPISVVAPISEASAEYQAIAYVLANPDTQVVCVDR